MSRPPPANGQVCILQFADIPVRPLRYRHLPRALATESRAFENNPTTQYIAAKGYDGPSWRRLIQKSYKYTVSGIFFAAFIRYYIALEVGEGEAILLGLRAGTKPLPNGVLGMLAKFVTFTSQVVRTSEQRARRDEFNTKMGDALERAFGERAYENAYLQLLCTDPMVQGRGYGSALMRTFNDMIDEGRNAYLISTDSRNTAFYNAAGFVVVEEWTLGGGKPALATKASSGFDHGSRSDEASSNLSGQAVGSEGQLEGDCP